MNLVIKLGYEHYLLTVPESVTGIVSSALLTAEEVIDPYAEVMSIRPLTVPPEVKIVKTVARGDGKIEVVE